MAKFENKDNITSLKMDGIKVKCFCPIGKSLCTYQVTIEMEPVFEIPDYIEVGEAIAKMENEEYTLESAVAHIFQFMVNYVNPHKLTVTVRCEDAKHMPATVTKTKTAEEENNSHEEN
jgi:NADPH-dependent 7-cyano-7-deazaguanine reductase QueF